MKDKFMRFIACILVITLLMPMTTTMLPVFASSALEKVIEKRGGGTRKCVTNTGEKNLFSGLLMCADCGRNMNFHFNQQNCEIRYFNCVNNDRIRKTRPTTRYIRVDFLEEVILQKIRRLTKFAS